MVSTPQRTAQQRKVQHSTTQSTATQSTAKHNAQYSIAQQCTSVLKLLNKGGSYPRRRLLFGRLSPFRLRRGTPQKPCSHLSPPPRRRPHPSPPSPGCGLRGERWRRDARAAPEGPPLRRRKEGEGGRRKEEGERRRKKRVRKLQTTHTQLHINTSTH